MTKDHIEWALRLLIVALATWVWRAESRLVRLEMTQRWLHGDVTPPSVGP